MARTLLICALGPLTLVACGLAPGGGEEAKTSESALTAPAIYVDCARTTDGDGSSGAPVRSITKALTLVQPGGAVYIRPGVCTERVDVLGKTNIVIERDPATSGVAEVAGNVPIRVDFTMPGCDATAIPAGRACNEEIRNFYATFDLYDVHDVTIRNLKITQDQNVFCPAPDSKKGCWFTVTRFDSTQTYLQDLGIANPAYAQTCLDEGNSCIEAPTPNAGFSGLTTGCCVTPGGTYCTAGANLAYTVTPHVCGRPLKGIAGINVGGASSGVRIENDDITAIKRGDRTKWITFGLPIVVASRESDVRIVSDVHVMGNTIHDLSPRDVDGDTFGGLTVVASDNVDGFEVGGNTLTNLNGAISINGNYAWADRPPSGPLLSPAFDRVRNSWIHDNAITNVQTYAIYDDGAARALIERNRIQDSQAGIGVVTEVVYQPLGGTTVPESLTSDTWVRDNVVIGTGAAVFGLMPSQAFATGMWLTAPGRPNYNPVNNVFVSNNTFALTSLSGQNYASVVNALPGIQGESAFNGNILVMTSSASSQGVANRSVTLNANRNPSFPSTVTFSTDYYYGTVGGVANTSSSFLLDGSFVTLAGMQASFPDPRARFVDPRFVGPAGTLDGYKIRSTSPARNQGPATGFARPSWATGPLFAVAERDAWNGRRVCSPAVDVGGDEFNTGNCP